MQTWKRAKLGVFVLCSEVAFLVLFGVFVRYDPLGMPTLKSTGSHVHVNGSGDGSLVAASATPASGHHDGADVNVASHITQYYAMFQDIHVMMFIGFGFLMTFLKRYGFSSVGLNFLVAAFVLQWATLTGGWIRHFDFVTNTIHVEMKTLIKSDFASAAVLISFGAVLGKISPIQLLVMALIEVVIFQVNEMIVFDIFCATDTGDSMVVHAFGAYFGITVAALIYKKDVHSAEEKESSVYHSDLFSMIGTIFLWLFWPSFNGGTAVDEGQLRAIINTYYSLTASAIVTFAISSLVNKDKFNMVHIQNATLAGGVAIGTLADLIIQPWAAILVGMVAGTVSVLGFHYITPLLSHKLRIHDTCGVNNLHGMPGIISGLGGILAAGLATPETYGDGLLKVFSVEGRTVGQLAGYQAAALGVSLGFAVVGGLITGLILRLPIWDQPRGEQIFDDEDYWLMPSATLEAVHVTSDSAVATPSLLMTVPDKTKPIELLKTTVNGIDGVEHKIDSY